jgi:spore germination cell wall hydrolase CwlJ-like protein
MAGGTARSAVAHARVARIAAAAAQGYSESALQAEADSMSPGALAVARRHDPVDGLSAVQRDFQASQFAAGVEPGADATGFRAGLTKAKLVATPAVAHVPPLRMSDANPLAGARELDCLAAAVYYEARGEGKAGQAAVAQVVLNRMRHPAFPHSVCGVVFQGAQGHACQFSFACDGSMHRGKETTAWRNARAVAARALGGYVMAAVGAAVSFHTTGVTPGWSMTRVAQVGSHVFYRFGGHAGRAVLLKASGVYTPAPEAQPQLILASAVLEQPHGASAATPIPAPSEPATPKGEARPSAEPIPEKGKAP